MDGQRIRRDIGHGPTLADHRARRESPTAVAAVEILSPGSRRTDTIIKRAEYADAGIGHYWILDLDGRPSLVACHLSGELVYPDAPPVTGTFHTAVPFAARLELDRLV